MCKELHTTLLPVDLPYGRHVIGFPVLEPLLTLLADGLELGAEAVHAAPGLRDAHDVVVLEERTGSAAQDHLTSW